MHLAPFKAIRPKPQHMQAWVNRQIDDYSEYLTGEIDFISLIQPGIGKSEEIRTRLKSYQKQNLLVTDAEPSLYLLQIQDDDVQTLGFIGCADTSLLVNKTIRPHEDVKKDQVKHFKEYIQNTQLNAEPVMLCHPHNKELEDISYLFTNTKPFVSFERKGIQYKLWRMNHHNLITRVNNALRSIDKLYIADGHHRSFSSLAYAKEDQSKNQFMVMVLPHQQIEIGSFCRMFKTLNDLRTDHFIAQLSTSFTVEKLSSHKPPRNAFEFCMYIGGSWFRLTSNRSKTATSTLSRIPTTIIYEDIAKPLLDIQDLHYDKQLCYRNYDRSGQQMKAAVDKGTFVFGIEHHPIPFSDIISTVDECDLLPPKSTHIKPKPLLGMLIFDFLSQ